MEHRAGCAPAWGGKGPSKKVNLLNLQRLLWQQQEWELVSVPLPVGLSLQGQQKAPSKSPAGRKNVLGQ